MARRMKRRRRRSLRPSVSIAGYTRPLNLFATAPASDATILQTVDVPDVDNSPSAATKNRKLVRVTGQASFAANLAANKHVFAQFCLWAHPIQEDWPTVADYDPFNDGPGESAYEGMLAPRAFCRRTFVANSPAGGVVANFEQSHLIRSKAERLLRPGWKLSAGLYVRGDSGTAVRWDGLLRFVVAG